MDCLRVFPTCIDAYIPFHRLPRQMARRGNASHDDEYAVLLDRHRCSYIPSLAYVRLTQCDEVSWSRLTPA